MADDDPRPRVITTRPIDLTALAQELGGAGLSAGPGEQEGETVVVVDEGGGVDKAQLQAAIDAHVPPPPPEGALEEARSQVRAATTVASLRTAFLTSLDAIAEVRP